MVDWMKLDTSPNTMFDLSAPATLRWTSKDVPRERRFGSAKEALRAAMKELSRAEFFSAHVDTAGDIYAGDQIVELFQRGMLKRQGHAPF